MLQASNAPKAAYSVAEFCSLVSLGRTRVFEEIRTKRLLIVKVGRRTLIPAAEVAAWLSRLSGELAPGVRGALGDLSANPSESRG